MTETITIDPRYNGPRGMGQGGYVCGRLAALLNGPAEITLRKPVPLGRALAVARPVDGELRISADGDVVAEARPGTPALDVPPPPSAEEAAAAAQIYWGLARHPVPTCYVCGDERPDGDGLRLFTGPVAGREVVASPWTPGTEQDDGRGRARPEFVWAVLDCPGGWAVAAGRQLPIVLGRLTGQVHAVPRIGEHCLVMGWPAGAEGRKKLAGTALFSESGELLAVAQAVWFQIAPEGETI